MIFSDDGILMAASYDKQIIKGNDDNFKISPSYILIFTNKQKSNVSAEGDDTY